MLLLFGTHQWTTLLRCTVEPGHKNMVSQDRRSLVKLMQTLLPKPNIHKTVLSDITVVAEDRFHCIWFERSVWKKNLGFGHSLYCYNIANHNCMLFLPRNCFQPAKGDYHTWKILLRSIEKPLNGQKAIPCVFTQQQADECCRTTQPAVSEEITDTCQDIWRITKQSSRYLMDSHIDHIAPMT